MPGLKRWQTAPAAPPDLLARYRAMSAVLAQTLYNRGLTDEAVAARFLQADDPAAGGVLGFRGKRLSIDRALSRIRQAIKARELIAVYGDFDADGVTSTALLMQTLRSLGANAVAYIPHRVDEGYGLNSDALIRLARQGVKLVITVDCGIRSSVEVEDGKAAGLDIIVTDHHTIGPDIPDAYAVINPKLGDVAYTEDMLAGVGVAFRLAEALLTIAGIQTGRGGSESQAPLTAEDLLDLVAIGTVADLAPLNRLENRALVKRGLAMLNQTKRPGLRALAEVAGLKPGSINASSIGFAIGPRINAAGRLDSAMIAYELLVTRDDTRAADLALQLQNLNLQRQELTRQAQEMIRSQLLNAEDEPLIFAGDPSFKPGIVGLVAGRLVEEFYRPAIILEQGETESRASCRSIPGFDITSALDQCADLLVRHGGHAQAAGFTVVNQNIPALRERLMALARQALDAQELAPTIDIDMELDARAIALELAVELQRLDPTGHSNPPPTFVTRGLRVLEHRLVGKDERHVRLKLGRNGLPPVDAIGFHLSEAYPNDAARVDVVYQLEINEWNGQRTPQLNLVDVRRASS
ncbi:MAG: single-stranded-DNA-specific exonuclease RecJ [Anaerolineae bacterium]|nr:single-stranded-DNA-specific exonuclease RecJ [Anaerolineae bacterium]NUQ04725.1 single-stranded-DNA-specific exonuclease RecJ [Anaerolineae bacterium]